MPAWLIAIALFLAVCAAALAQQDINELRKAVVELQNRLDVAELRLQTLLERLEEDGK